MNTNIPSGSISIKILSQYDLNELRYYLTGLSAFKCNKCNNSLYQIRTQRNHWWCLACDTIFHIDIKNVVHNNGYTCDGCIKS